MRMRSRISSVRFCFHYAGLHPIDIYYLAQQFFSYRNCVAGKKKSAVIFFIKAFRKLE